MGRSSSKASKHNAPNNITDRQKKFSYKAHWSRKSSHISYRNLSQIAAKITLYTLHLLSSLAINNISKYT